jgi:hypothetical protein
MCKLCACVLTWKSVLHKNARKLSLPHALYYESLSFSVYLVISSVVLVHLRRQFLFQHTMLLAVTDTT